MTRIQIYRLTAMAASLLFGPALAPAQTIVGWGDASATAPPGLYKAVSAGQQFVLGLNLNGTVTAWGINSNGQATVPAGLTFVTAVAAGLAHSLALQSGGTVVQWGDMSRGQGAVPIDLTGVTAIAAGFSHSLALTSGGTVVQWGDMSQGQGSVPLTLTGVVAIAAGDYHSLALKSDGTVVQWGDTSRRQGMAPPAGLTGVIAIAAGSTHSLALKSDGTVVQWGDMSMGQGSVPGNATGVIAIDAGADHSLALKSDGTVVAWGFDGFGQTETPTGLTGVVAINGGGFVSLAIQCQTKGVEWGNNSDGLGTVPVGSYKAFASGDEHALALATDGTVVQWGSPTNGQGSVPVGLAGVKAIAAGEDHSLALKSDGTVVQWGDMSQGQGSVPGGLTGVVAISAGLTYSLALKSDGTVTAWGSNFGNELGLPANLTGVTAIAGGGGFGLALKSNGTVVTWGDTSAGIATLAAGLTDVVAIKAGSEFGLALKSDGTVVAAGVDDHNQTDVPAGLANVIAVSTENAHTLALRSDGTVVAWGYDFSGETNVPANLKDVIAVAAGGDFSLALTASNIPVTIDSAPSGLSFTVTGTGCTPGSYTTPKTLNWLGVSCTVTFGTTQVGPAGTQYVFTGWSDGATTDNTRTFLALTNAATYIATFSTQYQLTTQVSPSGSGTVSGGGFYDSGSQATVTATANTGFQFVNWDGPTAQMAVTPTTVSMTGPQTVTGDFQLITTLSVDAASGAPGQPVTLTATLGPAGQAFTGRLQFSVNNVVAGFVNVTGAGIYTLSYTITQGVGSYPISVILTSFTLTASGASGGNTLMVSLQPQTITFGAIQPQAVSTQVALIASATSTLPVSFTSLTTGVCTVSGTTATLANLGTCTIQASQAGNTSFAAATPVSVSFTVIQLSQTITFSAIPGEMVGAQVALIASATSTLPVSFTSLTLGVCTVSGTMASMLAIGTCTIQASQAGNTTFAAATPVSRSFTVTKGSQTITFSPLSNAVPNQTMVLSASASSGLPVSFSVPSGGSPCAITNVGATIMVLPESPGTCIINATQAGDSNYAAAPVVSQSFTVLFATSIMVFNAIPSQPAGTLVALKAATNNGPLSGNGPTGQTVVFLSLTPGVCMVSGSTASLLAIGTCTIQASAATDGYYAAATAMQSFTVTQGSQTITFNAIQPQPVGTSLPLSALASSGLPVTYTSLTTGICTVSGMTANLANAGTCTIQASQAGTPSFTAALPVSVSFTVTQTPAPLTVVAYNVLFGSKSYNLIGSTRNRLPWQITGIQVVFSAPVGSATASSLSGVTSTAMTGLGTDTLTFTINPLSLGTFATSLAAAGTNAIADLSGTPLGAGTTFTQTVKVLWGDVNDDGVVSASDLTLTNNAQAATYNIIYDVNGDGVVNIADVTLVRTKIGTSLP